MITRIKPRQRIDVLKNDERSRSGLWGRWVYFGLLLVFVSGLLNYVAGSMIFLRADGIVLRPQIVVAAPYDAHVKEITARAGERVEAGARLARLESVEMTRSLSELQSQNAALRARIAQREGRLSVVEQVLPLARSLERDATDYLQRLQALASRGNSSLARLQETTVANYAASERSTTLVAELSALKGEVAENKETLAKAEEAYERLQATYNNGEIYAPASGTVGAAVAAAGEVLVTGKMLLEIFSGAPYVLAYLPDDYLFNVRQGQIVQVSSGSLTVMAVVDEILPVADSLPSEFRNAFRARQRSQLVRIGLPESTGFVLQQKVRVTSCYLESCESVYGVLAPYALAAARRLVANFRAARDYVSARRGQSYDLEGARAELEGGGPSGWVGLRQSAETERERSKSSHDPIETTIQGDAVHAPDQRRGYGGIDRFAGASFRFAGANFKAVERRAEDQEQSSAASNVNDDLHMSQIAGEPATTSPAAESGEEISPPIAVPVQQEAEPAAVPKPRSGEADYCGQITGLAQKVRIGFLPGSSNLDRAGREAIEQMAKMIKRCPSARIRVVGHTDAGGALDRNVRLSERRARSVADYLARAGVEPSKLTAVGYGASRPAAPNNTDNNRARNRRVEFVVTRPSKLGQLR